MRWLLALFAWRFVFQSGAWLYRENSVTGRRAARWAGAGYSPVDFDWLNAGRGHPEINGVPAWRSAQGQFYTPYFL